MKLLVVEDDHDTNDGICEYFKEAGYLVTAAYDGEQALIQAETGRYDLMLLDVMLPKLTGLTVLHKLRKSSMVPVIMLTAIDDEYTQITSFDGLADDYVTKPFSLVLLEKRVKALLRRGQLEGFSGLWHCQDIVIDFDGYSARGPYGIIDVTPREIDLLRLLLEHKGQVLSREKILNSLWKDKAVFDRTVDSHIKNLRRKLGLKCIVTVTGVGYKLEEET